MAEITLSDIELQQRVLNAKAFFISNGIKRPKGFVRAYFRDFEDWKKFRSVWLLNTTDEDITEMLERTVERMKSE